MILSDASSWISLKAVDSYLEQPASVCTETCPLVVCVNFKINTDKNCNVLMENYYLHQRGYLISQGSVATHLTCGGIFSDYLITRLLLSNMVKKMKIDQHSAILL